MSECCCQKRPITIEDLYHLKWVSDPQISPDGSRIAYVVKNVDPDDKAKYRNQIWVVNTNGGEPYAFTGGQKSDTSPRWSPDGKTLAFISNRSGDNQIWLIAAEGGEAHQLTKFKRPLGSIAWAPNGKMIVATAKIGPSDLAEKKGEQSDVKVITRLHYKQNGEGFSGDRRSHIFVVCACSGEVRQLTQGDYDHSGPTWSPDSSTVVFSAKRYDNADYVSYSDLYAMPVEGGEVKQLTDSFGPCSNPAFSPDGQTIAFYSHNGSHKGATLTTVYTVPAAGGTAKPLLVNFERSVGNQAGSDMVSSADPGPVWSQDATLVYFLATDHGRTRIYRVPAEGGEVEAITCGNRVVYGFSYSGEGKRLAYVVTEPTNAGDVYTSLACGAQETRLTSVNKCYFDHVAASTPERFTFTASNGVEVEGWMLKPYGFKPGVRYPMVLEIHGGPHVSYGYSFMHEFQVLCGKGYAVCFSNPQGSQGYGQEFNAATHHDWGGQDYRDVMGAVDYALTLDYIDADRLGITGGSYGGYMTNWIIGQTNRFKAAVTQRSTANRYSMFGTSDVGFFNGEYEQRGNPWENQDFYMEHSPISYVKNVQTPVLILHSEQDYRCPIEQGEQFFTALKWLGKEAVFVRFPDENHELSRSGKPKHRVERLQFLSGWFEKYMPAKKDDYCC